MTKTLTTPQLLACIDTSTLSGLNTGGLRLVDGLPPTPAQVQEIRNAKQHDWGDAGDILREIGNTMKRAGKAAKAIGSVMSKYDKTEGATLGELQPRMALADSLAVSRARADYYHAHQWLQANSVEALMARAR